MCKSKWIKCRQLGVLILVCGKIPNYTVPSSSLEMGLPCHGGLDAYALSSDSRGKIIYEQIMVQSLRWQTCGFIVYISLTMVCVKMPLLSPHAHTLTYWMHYIWMSMVSRWLRFWVMTQISVCWQHSHVARIYIGIFFHILIDIIKVYSNRGIYYLFFNYMIPDWSCTNFITIGCSLAIR